MNSTLPPTYIAFGMAVGVLASVVGFFACTVLWAHSRRLARQAPTVLLDHVALYSWGAVFFGGIALLLIQLMMGSAAIIPMPSADQVPLIVTTPIQLWALVCVAGMAAAKAHRVQKRFRYLRTHPPVRFVPHGVAMALLMISLASIGCTTGPLAQRTQPEMIGEAETYKAVAPEYLQLLHDSNLDAQRKAMDVRTVQTWYDRLSAELSGDPNYGQPGQITPGEADIYRIGGVTAPIGITATTQPANR